MYLDAVCMEVSNDDREEGGLQSVAKSSLEIQSNQSHSPNQGTTPDLLRCFYESRKDLPFPRTKEDNLMHSGTTSTAGEISGERVQCSESSGHHLASNYYEQQQHLHPFLHSDHYAQLHHPHPASSSSSSSMLAGGSAGPYGQTMATTVSNSLMGNHDGSNFYSTLNQQSFLLPSENSNFGAIYHHGAHHYHNQVCSQPYKKCKANKNFPRSQHNYLSNSGVGAVSASNSVAGSWAAAEAGSGTGVDLVSDNSDANNSERAIGYSKDFANFNSPSPYHLSVNVNNCPASYGGLNNQQHSHSSANAHEQHSSVIGSNLYEALNANAILMSQTGCGAMDIVPR